MQAIILAGGFGKRLRPLTQDIPKSMVPVLGRPYLEYQIKWLISQNIAKILILTGYLGEKIKSYFGDGSAFGVNINYSHEPGPLGTAGSLKLAQAKLEPYFALVYGDSFLPVDFIKLENSFLAVNKLGTVVVYDNRAYDTGVLNNMQLDNNGFILRYQKNSYDPELNFVEAGVMVFKKEITDLIPENKTVSLEEEIFPLLINKKELTGYVSKQPFYDIGTREGLSYFEEVIRSNNFLSLDNK